MGDASPTDDDRHAARRAGGRRRLRVHAQGPPDVARAARRTSPSSCATAPAPSRAARSATPTCWPGASSAATSCASPAASSASATSCRSSCARSAARPTARPTRPPSCRSPTATSTSSTASSSTSRARSTTRACRRCWPRCSTTPRCARDWRRAPCTRNGHHAYLGGLLEHTVAVGTLVARGLPAAPAPGLRPAHHRRARARPRQTREFTYGAEIGLTEAGRLLGHVELGLALLRERAARVPRARATTAASRSRTACSATTAPTPRPGRRFGSAEALALHRLNALDASVKDALEHGLPGSRRPRTQRAPHELPRDEQQDQQREADLERALGHGVGEHDAARRARHREHARASRPSRRSTLPCARWRHGADERHRDDRQQRRRLGVELAQAEAERQRGHEQRAAADAEQARRRRPPPAR